MLPVGAVYQNKAFFRKYVATYVYRTAERVGVLYHAGAGPVALQWWWNLTTTVFRRKKWWRWKVTWMV